MLYNGLRSYRKKIYNLKKNWNRSYRKKIEFKIKWNKFCEIEVIGENGILKKYETNFVK